MGAKYLPTVKDQKAQQRFLEKQNLRSNFIKAAGTRRKPRAKKK